MLSVGSTPGRINATATARCCQMLHYFTRSSMLKHKHDCDSGGSQSEVTMLGPPHPYEVHTLHYDCVIWSHRCSDIDAPPHHESVRARRAREKLDLQTDTRQISIGPSVLGSGALCTVRDCTRRAGGETHKYKSHARATTSTCTATAQ